MLAALLLNLNTAPPPAPPLAFRGGSPIWWRERVEDCDDEECELVEEIVEEAVEAVLTLPEPEAVVETLHEKFERIIQRADGVVRADARRIWREEVARRVQEQQDEEELMNVIAMIL